MVAVRGRVPSKGVGMRSCTALALVLALCLALAAPPAVAAEPRLRGYRGGVLLASLWSLLLPWWSPASVQKEGMIIDPLGGSQSSNATEAGMGIGNHQEAVPTTDEGMGMDPLG